LPNDKRHEFERRECEMQSDECGRSRIDQENKGEMIEELDEEEDMMRIRC
jgi:hypothetical protein